MDSVYIVLFYLAAFIGVLFLTDAVVGFVRAATGSDDDAVGRRLGQAGDETDEQHGPLELLRNQNSLIRFLSAIPFSRGLSKLIVQSGVQVEPSTVMSLIGTIFVASMVGYIYLLPISFAWFAILLAALTAVLPVLFYFLRKRSIRRRTFDEQLPDAIDLIVRSLKIGHPLSGAMLVIARDMPDPIANEFGVACEQVNYGRDVPSTLFEMADRVGASDLGYVAVAVQIQQESGGNLVESLAKLSAVVRDRFRMFRKVKAITAEGRFSAWMLSLFPLVIAGMITLVKPNYYTQVMNFPYFPHLTVLVIIMLIINVVAMRMLTTLKV